MAELGGPRKDLDVRWASLDDVAVLFANQFLV
jgi:hypothetical protein